MPGNCSVNVLLTQLLPTSDMVLYSLMPHIEIVPFSAHRPSLLYRSHNYSIIPGYKVSFDSDENGNNIQLLYMYVRVSQIRATMRTELSTIMHRKTASSCVHIFDNGNILDSELCTRMKVVPWSYNDYLKHIWVFLSALPLILCPVRDEYFVKNLKIDLRFCTHQWLHLVNLPIRKNGID